MPDPAPEQFLPLTPATFHILLALVEEERHGYGIMQEIAQTTGGALRMGPGTLYGSLKRLVADGLVEEVDDRAADDPRRRYYRLTALGRAVARADAQRMVSMVRTARSRKLIGPAGA
jgi:DNA-binding PadR family transcriptional regulator